MAKKKYDAAVTFVAGCVIEKDYVYLAAKLDSLDIEDAYTRIFIFDGAKGDSNWVLHDLADWEVVSVGVASSVTPRLYCSLSKDGNVRLEYVGGELVEEIVDAGLSTGDVDKYGYVSKIREIGNHLYVCGLSGQVYRREGGIWKHFDENLLRPVIDFAQRIERINSGDMSDFDSLFDDALALNDVNGIDESDIYTVGDSGKIFHFDGKDWSQVECGIDEILLCIKCVSRDEVWICGYNGALLKGNWKKGFVDVSGVDDNDVYSSVEVFKDVVYLASETGLSIFNGNKIQRLKTGLVPEIFDGNLLESKDGVLWSFGFKDIAFYDGTEWTRVPFPDNPPIR
ncbi:hypothetical protein [Massilia genomosp. 1]|uniref:Uncharacterized protein n=1 Tax=Massilia genomosp. 1 TaxID=2609280 RepID=A0ABX0MV92_9BURK|nr:hypothetical protein [Massilia genomosp. 1]NHZ66674.1 hypothetical protein [Massilia genomosp. 1]